MEDEQHFIFHCNYYNPKRCHFFAHMTKSVPNFMDLMEDEKLHNFMFKENVQEFSKYKYNIYILNETRENIYIIIYHSISLRL